MKEQIKVRFNKWLTPRRLYHILSEASLLLTMFVCAVAANALFENKVLALLATMGLSLVIHVITKFAGYLDGQMDTENKVALDPSKGKFAVIYYNEMPVRAAHISDGEVKII